MQIVNRTFHGHERLRVVRDAGAVQLDGDLVGFLDGVAQLGVGLGLRFAMALAGGEMVAGVGVMLAVLEKVDGVRDLMHGRGAMAFVIVVGLVELRADDLEFFVDGRRGAIVLLLGAGVLLLDGLHDGLLEQGGDVRLSLGRPNDGESRSDDGGRKSDGVKGSHDESPVLEQWKLRSVRETNASARK